ncbi:MAG: chromate transporter [Burkholderiaceae bacterium]
MPSPISAEPPHAAAPNQPRSKTDLFLSFNWLALQGFGGVLAVVQRELVEKKQWLTKDEFLEDWAVAQILPGPNVVNLAMMIGGRYFGVRGALAALFGMLLAPLAIVLLLAVLYGNVAETPMAQGALRGMGAVAAGLITATGIKLIAALGNNAMGMGVCVGLAVVTFVAIALLRLPLVGVLLVVGGGACLWAYRVIGHTERRQRQPAS